MSHPQPEKKRLVPEGEVLGEGTIGEILIEAGPAFSARTRLKVRGLNVKSPAEKEKVSLTLDQALLEDLRARAGDLPLSAVVNELLHEALARDRLRDLVERLEAEAGPAPPEAYERVLSQWFRDDAE